MTEVFLIRLTAPEGANPSGVCAAAVLADSAEHALQLVNEYATRDPLMSGDRFDASAYEAVPLLPTVADAGGVLKIKGRV